MEPADNCNDLATSLALQKASTVFVLATAELEVRSLTFYQFTSAKCQQILELIHTTLLCEASSLAVSNKHAFMENYLLRIVSTSNSDGLVT